jgi:MFS family permease
MKYNGEWIDICTGVWSARGMTSMDLYQLIRPTKKYKGYRRYLHAATFEGFPAIVIFFLLGGPYLTAYLLHLGATSFQIGIVLAIPSLANIMQIFAAFAMQRFVNRKMTLLVFGMLHRILWTLTGIIPLVFPSELWVPAYIVLSILAHVFNSTAGVVWTSLIADMVPARVRGKYFGIRNTLLWGIGSLSLFIGGQILERYPGTEGFYMIYIICAVAVVLNLIGYSLYPNLPFEKSLERDKSKMLLMPFKNKAFLSAMIFISMWMFFQGLAVPFFNYVMLDVIGISYQWVSIITIAQTVMMMLSYYWWGSLNGKIATKTLLLWTLPMIAFSCLLWGLIAVIPVIIVLLLVHLLLGIGMGGFNMLVFNFIIGDTPKPDRPMFIAVFSALTGMMGFMGPFIGGLIYIMIIDLPYWIQAYGFSVAVGLVLLVMGKLVGPKVFKAEPRLPKTVTNRAVL